MGQLISMTDLKIHLYLRDLGFSVDAFRATAQDRLDISRESGFGPTVIEIPSAKVARIASRNRELKLRYGITEIDGLLENAEELSATAVMSRELMLIRSLIKNFNSDFGTKVMLQLEIFMARARGGSAELARNMAVCEGELWEGQEEVRDILRDYYGQWRACLESIKAVQAATARGNQGDRGRGRH